VDAVSEEANGMKTVAQLLDDKGCDIWSIAPEDSVLDALRLMAKRNVGAVLVLAAGNLRGIVSERDFARRVALEGISAEDTRVWEIMTENVICVRADQAIAECMVLMTDKRIRHLPVLENNQLVGVISIGDVVKAIITEQEAIIEGFKDYMWGTEP
jgi:CBS domain-containing protein